MKVLEELNYSMSRRNADLIKANIGQTKYRLHDVGVQVCCCVVSGIYLSMLLCFHWKVFGVYIH